MAYSSLKDLAYVFVDGYDIAPAVESARMRTGALVVSKHFAGNAFPTAIDTGIRSGELEIGAVLTSTTDQVNAVSGTGRVVSLPIEGNTAGNRCYTFQSAKVESVEVGVSQDDVDSLNPGFIVAGEVNFGFIVHAYAERTTAGNTDAADVDFAAAVPAGAHAVLHVCAIDAGGGNGLTVTLRDCCDADTYGDHTAFTKTDAVGAEVVALATATDRYLSVSWAWDEGSDQSASFFVAVLPD